MTRSRCAPPSPLWMLPPSGPTAQTKTEDSGEGNATCQKSHVCRRDGRQPTGERHCLCQVIREGGVYLQLSRCIQGSGGDRIKQYVEFDVFLFFLLSAGRVKLSPGGGDSTCSTCKGNLHTHTLQVETITPTLVKNRFDLIRNQ